MFYHEVRLAKRNALQMYILKHTIKDNKLQRQRLNIIIKTGKPELLFYFTRRKILESCSTMVFKKITNNPSNQSKATTLSYSVHRMPVWNLNI